jgi:hypothetical protein
LLIDDCRLPIARCARPRAVADALVRERLPAALARVRLPAALARCACPLRLSVALTRVPITNCQIVSLRLPIARLRLLQPVTKAPGNSQRQSSIVNRQSTIN